jgi:hypothetical protein
MLQAVYSNLLTRCVELQFFVLVPVLLTIEYIERWQTQLISNDTVIGLNFL